MICKILKCLLSSDNKAQLLKLYTMQIQYHVSQDLRIVTSCENHKRDPLAENLSSVVLVMTAIITNLFLQNSPKLNEWSITRGANMYQVPTNWKLLSLIANQMAKKKSRKNQSRKKKNSNYIHIVTQECT
jgi:hypothetical protein